MRLRLLLLHLFASRRTAVQAALFALYFFNLRALREVEAEDSQDARDGNLGVVRRDMHLRIVQRCLEARLPCALDQDSSMILSSDLVWGLACNSDSAWSEDALPEEK